MKELLNRFSEHLLLKRQMLCELKIFDEKQSVLLRGNCTAEEIDQSMTEKDKLVDQMIKINSLFSALYDELAEKLPPVRSQYTVQLQEIAGINNEIAGLEEQLAGLESQNRSLIDDFLKKEKSTIKQGRQSSKAALGYYQNMNGMGLEQSHLWDSKH